MHLLRLNASKDNAMYRSRSLAEPGQLIISVLSLARRAWAQAEAELTHSDHSPQSEQTDTTE